MVNDGSLQKQESFDHDPGWLGTNNRSAQQREPIKIRQDFGHSPLTEQAGGGRGEIGGYITPAAEAAYYGKPIGPVDLSQPLSASGKMSIAPGGTHLLLGFFNSATVKEWRTPNTVAIRINGRGEIFFAYVEYCTSKWRAGGDTVPFPSVTDRETGRWSLIGYPSNKSFDWKLSYDPNGNYGKGVITATIGQDTAVCNMDNSHKADGATFDRFGILNVMKSADSGSEVWFDDISINGTPADDFTGDPRWESRNNRRSITTRIVRPWFDFGYSHTGFAGGRSKGEMGGQVFRGDCREPQRMACYGDRVGPLSLERAIKASGRVAVTRAVSDSTTLFGFYNSDDSMRQNESQRDGIPESVLGVHIEGPSSEGFKFYPVLRAKSGGGTVGNVRGSPTIYPDGKGHDWSLEYDPSAAGGNGQIVVSLDGRAAMLDLPEGTRARGTTFDRFGIITSWIDGNSQDVFFDDLNYTLAHD
jgi:hypothetical protein